MACLHPMGRVRVNTCARPIIFFSLLLVAGFPTGCTKINFADVRPGLETHGHYIENVPFYRQSESTCGPAALASIFAFWGHPESLGSITAAIYLPDLGGTLPMDMENFARKAGFETISSSGTLAELKIAIRKGTPVVCMLDLGFSLYRRPHYITVIGYDDVHAMIICHDGSTPNSLIGYDKFNKEWARAGRWMLKIEPKTDETRHAL
jgi:ABC-type bacteriocin/lantibiotic exporter with double-glycine peptidase domain